MIPMGGWHDFQSETMPNHVQVFLNRSHTHIESVGQILPTVTMRVCGHKVEYLKDAGKYEHPASLKNDAPKIVMTPDYKMSCPISTQILL